MSDRRLAREREPSIPSARANIPTASLEIHRPASGTDKRIQMTPMGSDDFFVFLRTVTRQLSPDAAVFHIRITAVWDGVPETAATWMEGELGRPQGTAFTDGECRWLAEQLGSLVQTFAEGFYSSAIEHGENPDAYNVQVPSLAAEGNRLYVLINVVNRGKRSKH
jgi:hypothetical protein